MTWELELDELRRRRALARATGGAFRTEEIIDPRDTRPLLCDWAERAHELVALDAPEGPVRRGTRP